MSNMFNSLLKEIDNEYAGIAEDGVEAGDVTGFIGTGSYSLNALLSGSIYGGLPANKVTALAGEPSTGKTFYAINIVRQFLRDNETGFVFYFESESAISKQMLADREIDTKRVAVVPVATIQEFRTQAVKILDKYIEDKNSKDRPPMLFVLDSLGNLSTTKEMEDIADGKDTRDMTRAQLVRGAFRVLTLKLGKAKVPLIVTNHVYDVVGAYVPTKKMGGGSGLEYAASTILFLSKKKDKDKSDNSITGAIITANLKKARLTIENKKVETLLDYATGLDPYYGLLDLAEKFGIFKKVTTRYELPNGTKVFESAIEKNPEKYFTKDILDQIDEKCKDEFLYGKSNVAAVEEE
jgi:RecA/RadA recombinase